MIVTVNGRPRELPAGATVTTVLELLGVEPSARGVAVAVAGAVIPRAQWQQTELCEGAGVEVLAAIAGG